MLSLPHLRTFLAVADAGGLRAAARGLSLSPAAVVEHLDRLEADLGARLLQRRHRPLALTAAGARLAPLARALLDTAERARDVVADGPLRVAAASNVGVYLLPPLVATFERATGKPVEIWIGSNPEAVERLAAGQADIAATEWWLPRPGFLARVWREEPLVAIAPPGHPWAALPAVPIDALARERLLGGERSTGTGAALRAAFGARAETLRVVNGYSGTEGVKRAVRAGLGVSLVLAASVADEVATGSLVVRPVAGADLKKRLSLVVPDELLPTDAANRFVAGCEATPSAAK